MGKKKYVAQDGYTYKRKVDNYIMGETLILGKFIDGSDDIIENYEEVIIENPDIYRQNREYIETIE